MMQPFSQSRWEQEGRHLFYLPEEPFARLEEPKPTYLIGTRGTGKTTLLKALNWRERLANRSLQRQLEAVSGSSDYFARRYVGVYFKLPRTHLTSFERLVGPKHRSYQALISTYLGLNWVDLLAEATAGLLEGGVLSFSADAERQAVRGLGEEFGDYGLVERYLGGPEVISLRALAKGTRRIRQHVERALQGGVGVDELASGLPMSDAGEFSTRAVHSLSSLYSAVGGADPWYFLVCMDEGEALTRSQQVAVNGTVRIAERPLIPIVAYLSLPESVTETGGSMTLTKADVDVVRVDALDDRDFRTFVEGVASVRMQEAAGEPGLEVDLDNLLGRLDINRLLEELLKSSADPWGRELLAKALGNREVKYFESAQSAAPPIYQTYLSEALGLEVPSATSAKWRQRGRHSAEIRKKMVAAYLSICRRLRAEPRYASAGMLVQMCDGCVRDFLWQMHELYREAGVEPLDFLARELPADVQNRALRRASAQKMERLGDYVLAEETAVSRFINSLGRLTARMQRPTEGELQAGYVSHLRTSEPGLFRLPAGESIEEHTVALRLLAEAVDANYIRWDRKADDVLRFRVHTSLAPFYGFSYRGAYADVVLEAEDLRHLYAAVDEGALAEVIERVARPRSPLERETTIALFDPPSE